MAPPQPAAAPCPKRPRRVPAKHTVLDPNPNPQSSPPDANIHTKTTRQSPILVPDSPPPPPSPSPLERVPRSINPSPAITTGIMERESVGTGRGGVGGLQDVQSLDCANGSVDGLVKTETNEDIMLVEAGKVVSDCIEVRNLEIEEIYEGPKESCAGEPLLELKKYDDVAEEVNVELDGDGDGKCMVDGVEGTGGDKERGKGLLENKMVLSGELEALERRRKRRTQVSVGGLSVASKEEDVRKVFEQVGEVVEVKVVTNSKTGKSKGFAFVRYACAADAKNALERLRKVEVK